MIISLGCVAIFKKSMKPYAGAAYSAGAKIYSSEKVARDSIKRSYRKEDEFIYRMVEVEVIEDKT